MAAIAIHVVDQDVVAASNSDTVILVDHHTVAYLGVVGTRQVEA